MDAPTIDRVLADGTYDVVVVDANEAESSDDGPAVGLELAILAGEHKGEMVRLTATGIDRDPLDLLALPATLTVTNGKPCVVLED